MKKEEVEVRDILGEVDPNMLCADGYDEAIIGYTLVDGEFRVVYDMSLMVEILMEMSSCPVEEAVDYLQYNCWNLSGGNKTPIYVEPIAEKSQESEIDE